MNIELELVVDTPAVLGEGPCWHEAEQVLYWVDIEGDALRRFDPATGKDEAFSIGESIGTVAPRASGGLVLALRSGIAFYDPATGTLEAVADPEADLPTNRFNDGKCDPAGRFWAGTLEDKEETPDGSLYRMDADLSVHKIEGGITVSNGITWSPDYRTMYYIDSPTKRVDAFDYDNETGAASNRRTVVEIDPDGGYPDGMTSDEDGMLWVAQWDGWCVARYDPSNGKQLAKIETPAARASACCFGGANRDELYITTAKSRLTDDELAAQPLAGCLFRCKPGVRGIATFSFAG